MQSSSHPTIERARPLLGTLVSIQIAGLPPAQSIEAIERAFAAVQRVHSSMSFHCRGSELSRLNRTAHVKPVQVSRELWSVLSFAQQLSAETDGIFDVTVAPSLVEGGLLPQPQAAVQPCGTWRDIILNSSRTISFRKPLWIDLGGIAKGYAVDCATKAVLAAKPMSAVINAGGDLRVIGSTPQRIGLRIELPSAASFLPVLDLCDGSVASSSTTDTAGAHIHGRSRKPLPAGIFASVVAESCMVADALTKLVLASPAQSARILRHFGAEASVCNRNGRWSHYA